MANDFKIKNGLQIKESQIIEGIYSTLSASSNALSTSNAVKTYVDSSLSFRDSSINTMSILVITHESSLGKLDGSVNKLFAAPSAPNVANGLKIATDGSIIIGGTLISDVSILLSSNNFKLYNTVSNSLLEIGTTQTLLNGVTTINMKAGNNTTTYAQLYMDNDSLWPRAVLSINDTTNSLNNALIMSVSEGAYYSTPIVYNNVSTNTLISKGHLETRLNASLGSSLSVNGSTYSVQSKSASNTLYGDSGFLYGATFGATFPKTNIGSDNEIIGYGSGTKNISGVYNVILGSSCGRFMTSAQQNTVIGSTAGKNIITAQGNVLVGYAAGRDVSTSQYNVIIGLQAGAFNINGTNNVIIGTQAGVAQTDLSGSVIIGFQAANNETRSNTLNISNSNSPAPLIYGQFDSSIVNINNKLGVGLAKGTPTAYLHLVGSGGTANTSPIKFSSGTLLATPEAGAFEYDGSSMYMTDVSSARHQLVESAYGELTLTSASFSYTSGTSSPLVIGSSSISAGDTKLTTVSNTAGTITISNNGNGYYLINYSVGVGTNSDFDLTLCKNSSSTVLNKTGNGGGSPGVLAGSAIAYLAVGDNVALYGQGSGNARTIWGYSLTAVRIGR